MSRILNTGENAPLTWNALEKIARSIVASRMGLLRRALGDVGGVYCYLMSDLFQQPYFLVAKTSRIWSNMVSVQRAVLEFAKLKEYPVVLAHMLSSGSVEDVTYYLMVPEEVLDKVIGENWRMGAKMVNFSEKLLKHLDSPSDVRVKWLDEKTRYKREKSGKQVRLEVFGV
jgi:hypothetical protein